MTQQSDDAAAALATRKAAARKAAFARRKAARAADPDADARAAKRFLAAIAMAPDDIVGGYRPIRTEIDPTPLLRTLHDQGRRLAVPVIQGAGQPLLFREWTPGSEMTEGPFGAQVPASGAWLEPTLLVAPLVAWRRDGARLGYGGGFYDRTLLLLRGRRPTRAFGYAYAAQEDPELPTEPTDQRLDGVVTEREAILL